MHNLIVYCFVVLISFVAGFALGRLKGIAITKVFQDHINALEALAGNTAQVEGTKIRQFIDDLRKKL